MRFGLFIPQGWRLDLVDIPVERHWEVMNGLATYADGGAWDSLWVYDHFHTVPMPTGEATHEAWSLMSAYAATTSRVKLGQMCTAMSYRNPAYLAKVAATADIISGGRVQMGIGGGWYEHEGRGHGDGVPPPLAGRQSRCGRTGFRWGSPEAASRRRYVSPRSTRSTPTSPASRPASRTSP